MEKKWKNDKQRPTPKVPAPSKEPVKSLIPEKKPGPATGSPVTQQVQSERIMGGDFSEPIYAYKKTFTDTVQGYRWGIDPRDKVFKWTIGSPFATIDFGVTSPGVLTFNLPQDGGASNAIRINDPGNNAFPALDIRRSVGTGVGLNITSSAGSAAFLDGSGNTPTLHVISTGSGSFSVPTQFENDVAQHADFYEITELRGGSVPDVSCSLWVGNNTNPNSVLPAGKGDVMLDSDGHIYVNVDGSTAWNTVWTSSVPFPLTTKGDLLGFDTVPDRVPVGTNDQTLIADSTQALGLKWGTLQIAGGGTGATTAAAARTNLGAAASGVNLDITAMENCHLYYVTNTDATHVGEIRFFELASNGVKYIGLAAPANITGPSLDFFLPAADGSAGQFLKTDGSGNLSFGSAMTGLAVEKNGTLVGTETTLDIIEGTHISLSVSDTPGTKVAAIINASLASTVHALTFNTSLTVDWSTGEVQTVTLTNNTTLTFTNMVSGTKYQLIVTQDGTGSRLVTWPTIKWRGGSAPTLTTTASATDLITLEYVGTTWYGDAGLNFA